MSAWRGPYAYFSKKEMQCRCGCEGLPEHEFMERLMTIREECSFPFIISSGYRCPDYNNLVSTSGYEGPHTLGLGADIVVYGPRAALLVKVAFKHGIEGIGVGQKLGIPNNKRSIHLDIVPNGGDYVRPLLWSY